MTDKQYLHFENELKLVQGLLIMLNDQYEHAPDEEKESYYDWIYWVLDKSENEK